MAFSFPFKQVYQLTNDLKWLELGLVEELKQKELQQIEVENLSLALTFREGVFSVISGKCNHVGGPLGEGKLQGDYVECPWHFWQFHHLTGKARPPYDSVAVPTYKTKIEDGRLFVNTSDTTARVHGEHPPHPLTRSNERQPGPIRLVGISTTAMTAGHPRTSTSELLLQRALEHAAAAGCETKLIRIEDLKFRACEGFYSKSASACTWPCSITQMDPEDQMDRVYEAFVHWGDAFVIATPIRWGSASSLYYKMVERMNCIQNQETIANKHLLKNKTVGLIITGGQDNVQAVAGQMLGFFAEIGCQFPQFPYIAHSRGWSAEDMENNVRYVENSESLKEGADGLVDRIIAMANLLVVEKLTSGKLARGGRKAFELDVKAQL